MKKFNKIIAEKCLVLKRKNNILDEIVTFVVKGSIPKNVIVDFNDEIYSFSTKGNMFCELTDDYIDITEHINLMLAKIN